MKLSLILLPLVVVFSMNAQTPQNIKSGGNTLSSEEYVGSNNNEDFVVKTNNSNNTIFKKNGEVKMISLQGTGNRVLFANDNGVLNAFPAGQLGQVLSADGIWIDPPVNYWQISANGNRIWTDKNKVGINMNAQPLFTLDVNGDGHFTGNLVLNGELIINEKITSPKQLFAKSMEVDSIKMDSNKAIYGETTIKGDVKAKYKLSVDGDATFNGNSTIGGNQFISGNQDVYGNQNVAGSVLAREGLKFTSGKGISETATTHGQVYAYGKGGSGGTGPFDPGLPACFNPTVYPNAVTTHQFGNLVQIFSTDNTGTYVGGGSVLNMQSWETVSSIDAAGGQPDGGLLINYFCGKNVAICTGEQGGTVFTGLKTSMAKHVGIGSNWPNSNVDENVALNIFANENNQTALKMTVWNGTVKAIDLVNTNGVSSFNVLQNGSTVIKGTLTVGDASNAGAYNDITGLYVGPTNGQQPNVGIGTATPSANLDVSSRFNEDAKMILGSKSNDKSAVYWAGNWSTGGVGFGQYNNQGGIFVNSNAAAPEKILTFARTTNGPQVWIGDRKPTHPSYSTARLSVDGTIIAKEIYVLDDVHAQWADYVFEKDYKMMSLKEVDEFVKKNKHLPNVPSANEISEQGKGLGELQVVQMEKIEELYLYMIEMNKKMEKLEQENEKLKELLLKK